MNLRWLLVIVAALALVSPVFAQKKGKEQKELRWAADPSGGAPYVYKDDKGKYIGFEVELAEYLAKELGRSSEMVSGDWDKLPELLGKPDDDDDAIDIVLNGYEFREDLEKKYPSTIPYYVYKLALVIHQDDANVIRSWNDLTQLKDGKRRKVTVLSGSVAQKYMAGELFGDKIELSSSQDVAPVIDLLEQKRIDATVQDLPAALYYVKHGKGLKFADEPRKPGFCVILTRPKDKELREQLNAALKKGIKDGTLKKIYEKYGLWNEDQERLSYWSEQKWPPIDVKLEDEGEKSSDTGKMDWGRVLGDLVKAAGMTIFLAVASFPIAMCIGMLVALGRVYGPLLVRFPLGLYVEFLRGTPLLLQLYFVFYLLPQLIPGFSLTPIQAGILGLAINYSAYEAENYRAGLLAIPRGQMEASLALGMNPFTALRVVIVPQAVRIVIPPVTNDFIALFKDTSVCSVILITELTRKYNELYNFNRAYIIHLAFITASLYLMMSYPLAIVARFLEKRLGSIGRCPPMIRATNIVKYHGDTRILDGASLEVQKGQVAALVGQSGSGKSTLLRCINGLEEFQEGEVAVNDSLKLAGGQSAPRSTLLQLRRTVGMVFQQFNLFPHMSVLKNVMAGPIHSLGQPHAEAEAVAKKWLDRVGLAEKHDAKPSQLSGGQQQRVAIARALAVNPAAILFDEPTSALDPKMSAEVMRVIDDLADDQTLQVAMVIVTHDIPAVKRIADVVHLLNKGKVVYSGPAAEAFAPGGPAAALD